jgi:CTP synthase (UTP-ammonia lyase)
LVGDQNPDVKAHPAIPRALALAAEVIGGAITSTWMPTGKLHEAAAPPLRGFQGIWCVPGSPYASTEGALSAIRFARERSVPFLGTCGGFQHALIEYSRNALGHNDADHAESNPETSLPIIVPLACALRETESRIHLAAKSRARTIYGRAEISESFNCGFGLNREHHDWFANDALRITGVGDDDSARIVEHSDHPFFMATLFQPERSAFRNVSHPLIVAFVQAALHL